MKTRAFVIPAIVWLLTALGVAAGVAVPNLRPTHWFQKDPVAAADEALAKAQADAAKAKLDAKQAQDVLEAARTAELARKDSQLGYAQQMASGAAEALRTATPEPPVKLAIALLDRTNNGLAAAIGTLPIEKQAEIVKIVTDSLSGVQAKLDEANAELAEKDKALAVATTERDALKIQIPKLEQSVETKQAALVKADETVVQKTTALASVAEKIQAEIKESGSLSAQLDSWGRLALFLGLLYVAVHYLLPSVAAEFPQVRVLQGVNRTLTSLFSAHEIVDQTQPPKT